MRRRAPWLVDSGLAVSPLTGLKCRNDRRHPERVDAGAKTATFSKWARGFAFAATGATSPISRLKANPEMSSMIRPSGTRLHRHNQATSGACTGVRKMPKATRSMDRSPVTTFVVRSANEFMRGQPLSTACRNLARTKAGPHVGTGLDPLKQVLSRRAHHFILSKKKVDAAGTAGSKTEC